MSFELRASSRVESSQVRGTWRTDSNQVGSLIKGVVRAFLQGLGLILVSSGIMWIIEMIIVAVDVHCGVAILLLLFIFAQVLCRLHDFDWAWKGGLVFVPDSFRKCPKEELFTI